MQTEEKAKGDEMVVDEEAKREFEDIDKLQEHGVNATDIKKLKAEGLYTIASLTMATKKSTHTPARALARFPRPGAPRAS
jgi:hypothetical protein